MADSDIKLSVGLNAKDAEKEAKQLEKEIEKIFDARGSEQQSAAMTQQLINMKKNAQAAGELIDRHRELNEEIQRMSKSILGQKALAEVQDYSDRLTKLTEKMRDMLDYGTQVQMPDGSVRSLHNLEMFIEGQRQLERQNKLTADSVEKLRQMEAIYAAEHERVYSSTTFKYDIEDTQGEIVHMSGTYEDYMKILNQMNEYNEYVKKGFENLGLSSEASAEQIAKLRAELAATEEKLEQVNDKTKQLIVRQQELENSDPMRETRQGFSTATRSVMGLNMAIRGVGRLIPGVKTTAVTAVASVSRGLLRLASITKEQVLTALNTLKTAITKLFKFLLTHPAVTAIIALVGVLIALLIKLKKKLDEFKELMSKIGEKTLELLKRVPRGLNSILKTLLKLSLVVQNTFIRGVSAIIKKLLSLESVIKENIDLMVLWRDGNNAVNKSMSNLTSSLAYLKASFSSAFAPILTTIEPLLTSLSDKIAEVCTNVGIFIAQITGQTKFQKAIRYQRDYAKSIAGTNEQLASFDKLNVLAQSGGADDPKKLGVEFEELNVEPLNLDLLEELFKKAQKIASKFIKTLDKIPWDKIKEGADDAALSISNFVNGFAEYDGLGDSVGTALGEVINTTQTFFDTLMDNIKFDKLGKQIGDFFGKALDKVKWKDVAKTMWKGVRSALAFLRGFLETNPGTKLGKSFSTFLNGALQPENIPWTEIKLTFNSIVSNIADFLNEVITPENLASVGTTLGEVMNTVVTAAKTFTDKVNWEQWGTSLGSAINNFFRTWNFEFAAKTLSNIAVKLLKGLKAAVTEIKWDQIGAKIVKFLANIDWKNIGLYAVSISKSIRDGLSDVWAQLKKDGVFSEMIQLVIDILNEADEWKKFFSQVKKDALIEAATAWAKDELEVVEPTWGAGKHRTVGKGAGRAAGAVADYNEEHEDELNLFQKWGNLFKSEDEKQTPKIVETEKNTKETVDTLTDIEKHLLEVLEEIGSQRIHDLTGMIFTGSLDTLSYQEKQRLYSLLRSKGYASGTVIPPTASEFLAKVGDNKQETEVISPLSTIEQALRNVMGEQNMKVVFQVEGDPNGMFKVMRKKSAEYTQRTGSSAFA